MALSVQQFVDKWECGWNVNTSEDKASKELEAEMKADLEEMLEASMKKGMEVMGAHVEDNHEIYRLGYEINEIMERWKKEDKRLFGAKEDENC